MFGMRYNIKNVKMTFENGETADKKLGIAYNKYEVLRYIRGYAKYHHNCPLVTVPKEFIAQKEEWWKNYEASYDRRTNDLERRRKDIDGAAAKLILNGAMHSPFGILTSAFETWDAITTPVTKIQQPSMDYQILHHHQIQQADLNGFGDFQGNQAILFLNTRKNGSAVQEFKEHNLRGAYISCFRDLKLSSLK